MYLHLYSGSYIKSIVVCLSNLTTPSALFVWKSGSIVSTNFVYYCIIEGSSVSLIKIDKIRVGWLEFGIIITSTNPHLILTLPGFVHRSVILLAV
jgi:hypothetical protein